MILSFGDKENEKIWNKEFAKTIPKDLQRIARRKLLHIDSAIVIEDLKAPPGNRLQLLSGDRKGQYSISINMQYRICFRWDNGNALEGEIRPNWERIKENSYSTRIATCLKFLFLKMENCAYTFMSFHVSKILPALRQTVIVYSQLAANTFK